MQAAVDTARFQLGAALSEVGESAGKLTSSVSDVVESLKTRSQTTLAEATELFNGALEPIAKLSTKIGESVSIAMSGEGPGLGEQLT